MNNKEEADIVYMILISVFTLIIIVAIVMITASTIDLIISSIHYDKIPTREVEVDCYDKNSNLIIGVKCSEIQRCSYFGWINSNKCSDWGIS